MTDSHANLEILSMLSHWDSIFCVIETYSSTLFFYTESPPAWITGGLSVFCYIMVSYVCSQFDFNR